MKFATEELVDDVLKDVASKVKLDRDYRFTLTWSSSGTVGYLLSLEKKYAVTGSLIAMSVYKPDQLPSRKGGQKKPYYLLHSPTDFIPIAMAEQAEQDLSKNRAKVKLQRYEGGHGWPPTVYRELQEGVAWLENHHAR